MNDLPYNLFIYFKKWQELCNNLKENEEKLCNIKDKYKEQENEILLNTDFKSIYGQNNEKIRNQHIKKELENLYKEKQKLTLQIETDKRALDWNICMVQAKIKLLR